MKSVIVGDSRVKSVTIGDSAPMVLIAGPCVIENKEVCFQIAEFLKKLSEKLGISYIFKASFDKANRTSLSSFRGLGTEEGLEILRQVREQFSLPVVSDIHLPDQAAPAAEVLDMLQIPAFLARQTDLLVAAAKTGKCVQVKKAQFMAPWDMKNVVEKIVGSGNDNITLIERGSSFGYNQLICDMTSFAYMKQFGYPTIMDATHSTQKPSGLGGASGGSPEMAPILARAAIAAGANGLFIETHPRPEKALSDAACMLPLDQMEKILTICRDIFEKVRDK
jgi:2-dehydro-3-deoxyphosphooctonate aldolase (KDO 8-P synthase)